MDQAVVNTTQTCKYGTQDKTYFMQWIHPFFIKRRTLKPTWKAENSSLSTAIPFFSFVLSFFVNLKKIEIESLLVRKFKNQFRDLEVNK